MDDPTPRTVDVSVGGNGSLGMKLVALPGGGKWNAKVASVMGGSNAAVAGVFAGALIQAVEDVSVEGLRYAEVLSKIKVASARRPFKLSLLGPETNHSTPQTADSLPPQHFSPPPQQSQREPQVHHQQQLQQHAPPPHAGGGARAGPHAGHGPRGPSATTSAAAKMEGGFSAEEVLRLKSALAAKEAESVALVAANQDLEGKLDTAQARLKTTEESSAVNDTNHAAEKKDLLAQLDEARAELDKWAADMSRVQHEKVEEIATLRRQGQEARAVDPGDTAVTSEEAKELEKLRDTVKMNGEEMSILRAQHAVVVEELEGLKTRDQTIHDECARLKGELLDREKALATSLGDLETLKSSLASKDTVLKKMAEAERSLTGELNTRQAAWDTERHEFQKNLEAALSNLSREQTAWESRCSALETEVRTKEEQVVSLQQEIAESGTQANGADTASLKKEQAFIEQIAAMETKFQNSLQSELEAQSKKLQQEFIIAKENDLNKATGLLKQQLTNATEATTKMGKNHAKEMRELVAKVEDLKKSLAAERQTFVSTKEAHGAAVTELQSTIRRLEEEMEKIRLDRGSEEDERARRQENDMKVLSASLESQLKRSKNESEMWKEELERTKGKLKVAMQYEMQCEELTYKLQSAESDLEEAKKEIKTLRNRVSGLIVEVKAQEKQAYYPVVDTAISAGDIDKIRMTLRVKWKQEMAALQVEMKKDKTVVQLQKLEIAEMKQQLRNAWKTNKKLESEQASSQTRTTREIDKLKKDIKLLKEKFGESSNSINAAKVRSLERQKRHASEKAHLMEIIRALVRSKRVLQEMIMAAAEN